MDRRILPSNVRNQFVDALDRLSLAVERRFEVDLRALAAFRIALGTLLIVDLARRARNLRDFYTNSGVLPLSALFSDYESVYSLHAVSGEAWVQALLFLVAGAFALAMVVGVRTRLATVVSWVLLLSLHTRNPMVLNGGDVLFRMLLFWGMFLPLGERWSVDARRIDRTRSSAATVATMAVLLQMVLVYATNAGHKAGGELWLNGEAIVYVFSLDQFTILLGNHLAELYPLLRAMAYVWLLLLVLSPLLVLLTGIPRAILASLFAGMHLGMLVTMRLDLFPLIVVAGLVPFYPPVVWDAVAAQASRLGVAPALGRWAERVERVRPDSRAPRLTAPDLVGGLARGRALFSTVLPLLFLVLVVLSNAQAVGYATVPDRAEPALDATGTEQRWKMFAPDPLRIDGWYVVPGKLENGSRVDVLHGSAVTWDRPANVEDTYPTARWRKYLSNVWSGGNTNHRSYLGAYLCNRWNGQHETEVDTLTIYYMSQSSQPYNETEPITRHELHTHDC